MATTSSIPASLLRWYDRQKRDLPWRGTRDPWAILVSEFMLQQTRVEAVIPYWRRFMERFPDAAALARAGEADVLAAWSGLGYYRRARHLHEAARIVAKQGLPRTAPGWRELPGIGPYAAAALEGRVEAALQSYSAAAEAARGAGLGVNAGHDLNLDNLRPFLERTGPIDEVSIGHALIADALELGLAETVRRYLAACGA